MTFSVSIATAHGTDIELPKINTANYNKLDCETFEFPPTGEIPASGNNIHIMLIIQEFLTLYVVR